ncbi:zinc finger BED domain-containing protein 4-like protein [Aphelenchoides avenae]|nr:zinc finger BED domain-containing protein 4-like protein [Aphelenchus avenae]
MAALATCSTIWPAAILRRKPYLKQQRNAELKKQVLWHRALSTPTSIAPSAPGSQPTTILEPGIAFPSANSSQSGSGKQEKVFRYFDRKVADRSLAKLIVGADLPLSLVDNKHFRAFVAALNPEYNVPSRSTLTDRLDSYCEEVEVKIKENIDKADSVSCTTDIWSAKNQKKSILSLTVHFTDEKGQPAFHTAAVLPLKCRHEGELLAPEFRNLLDHYGLRNGNAHVLLRDAASNMKKMARILGLTSLDCFGHKLHNLTGGTDGLEQLPSLTNLIEKAKKIIRKLRKSGVELHRFEQLRDELCLPRYVLIKIRWNSAFEMLKRLLVLRPAVEQLIASSEAYPQISADEWGMARMVVDLLHPIVNASKTVQDRRESVAAVLPIYVGIKRMNPPASGLARMHKAIVKGLDTRMVGWRENDALCLATALDPNLKLSPFNTDDVNHVRKMLETKAIARSAELNGDAASACSSEPDAGNGNSLMKFLQSVDDLPEREVAEIDPNATAKAQVEVAEYFKERPTKGDPYAFWSKPKNVARFPVLHSLARQYLAAPPGSVESERVFSGASAIFSDDRQSLSDNTLERLLFLYSNVNLI